MSQAELIRKARATAMRIDSKSGLNQNQRNIVLSIRYICDYVEYVDEITPLIKNEMNLLNRAINTNEDLVKAWGFPFMVWYCLSFRNATRVLLTNRIHVIEVNDLTMICDFYSVRMDLKAGNLPLPAGEKKIDSILSFQPIFAKLASLAFNKLRAFEGLVQEAVSITDLYSSSRTLLDSMIKQGS